MSVVRRSVLRALQAGVLSRSYARVPFTPVDAKVDAARRREAQEKKVAAAAQRRSSQIREAYEEAQANDFVTAGASGGLGTIAELKMKQWEKDGGSQDLEGAGKPLNRDGQSDAMSMLGVDHETYLMTKIMKANNVKPLSIERRLEVQDRREDLRRRMLEEWSRWCAARGEDESDAKGDSDAVELFLRDVTAANAGQFTTEIKAINQLVQKANDALIADSVLFAQNASMSTLAPLHPQDIKACIHSALKHI